MYYARVKKIETYDIYGHVMIYIKWSTNKNKIGHINETWLSGQVLARASQIL